MLIDIEKLKNCNSVKVKLSEAAFNSYLHNVGEYFDALEGDSSKMKANEAVDVISILADFKEYFVSELEWESLTRHLLNLIRLGVTKSTFNNVAIFSGLTHVAYSVYVLSVQAPKIKPFLQGINDILLDKLNDFLRFSEKEEFYTVGNYEVIAGLTGPFRYLLDNIGDEQVNEMIERLIGVFLKRSKNITILGYSVPGWHYFPSEMEASHMTETAPNGCINYGVSHGMGGPLAVLSMAYHNGFDAEELKDAIDRLVSEYMNAVYYCNDVAYWPGRISIEQYIGQVERQMKPNQMSWCYGSPGNLRALYLAGVYTNNSKLKQYAIDELIKIADLDFDGFMLSQPIVCHGYAGTAAIMNLMYLDTGRNEFLHKTVEMTEASAMFSIERYFANAQQLANNANMDLRADLHSHLEGYNGIIHTILSIIKGLPSENEKRLLML